MNETEMRMNLVLDMAQLGTWDFKPHDQVLNWSALAKSFFGLSAERQITYKLFLQGLHPEDRKKTHKAIQAALKKEVGAYNINFRTVGIEDKKVRYIAAKGTILFNNAGEPVRLIGVSTDLTDTVAKENELKLAKHLAEGANEAKSQFLANISHEIRTPLGAMVGFAELASDPAKSQKEVADYLQIVQKNGGLLLKLVNEILDISKVEANKLEIEEIDSPFAQLLDEVIPVLRHKAHEKGLQLTAQSIGPIPKKINTDPTRLKQIINNLVSNAIKFTDKGKVEIFIRTVKPLVLGKRIIVEIKVVDQGIGISPEHQKILFKRFSQADNTVTRKFGGTGLGLLLSKQLANALHGDISLEKSEVGKGSTFVLSIEDRIYTEDLQFVDLKLTEDTPPPILDKLASKDLDGVRVLLVDDTADNRVLVSLFLKSAGAAVDIAENGLEALKLINKSSYDVVLMDIQMPVLDGYTATKTLRNQGYRKPIIALTAHAMSGEKEKCLKCGFDDHLTKPVNRKLLIQEISQLTHHS